MFDVTKFVEGLHEYLALAFQPIITRLQAIEDRAPPKDGVSVTLDDVTPLVRGAIAEAVATLPTAKDTDPADLQRMVDEAIAKIPPAKDGVSVSPDEVAQVINVVVAEAVSRAVADLPPAKDGVTLDDVIPMIKEAVAALPPPKDGVGVTVDQVMPDLLAAVEKAVSGIPLPADGKSVTVADVLPAVESNFNAWALDFERRAQSLFRDAIAAIPAPKDGVDALGFDDMDVADYGEGNVTIRFMRGEQVKEFPIKLPCFVDRGVWIEGESYPKGSGVTWAGSLFLAQVDNATGKPGESDDYRLAVKRGRDGKSAK